jgi:hypothetical protein
VWRTLAGLAIAIVLAITAGWFALDAMKATKAANEQRDYAAAKALEASQATETAEKQRDRALLQESRALATLAQEASKAGD